MEPFNIWQRSAPEGVEVDMAGFAPEVTVTSETNGEFARWLASAPPDLDMQQYVQGLPIGASAIARAVGAGVGRTLSGEHSSGESDAAPEVVSTPAPPPYVEIQNRQKSLVKEVVDKVVEGGAKESEKAVRRTLRTRKSRAEDAANKVPKTKPQDGDIKPKIPDVPKAPEIPAMMTGHEKPHDKPCEIKHVFMTPSSTSQVSETVPESIENYYGRVVPAVTFTVWGLRC